MNRHGDWDAGVLEGSCRTTKLVMAGGELMELPEQQALHCSWVVMLTKHHMHIQGH